MSTVNGVAVGRLLALEPHGPWDNVSGRASSRIPTFRSSGTGHVIRVNVRNKSPTFVAYHHGPGPSSLDDPLFTANTEQRMVEQLTGYFERGFTGVDPR